MSKLTPYEFFEKIKIDAQNLSKIYNIPVALIMAQSALESSYGNSTLTTKGNNLFGMKQFNLNSKDYVLMNTIEYENGVAKTVIARFKSYSSWFDSLNDYCSLIVKGVTWDKNKYNGVIDKDSLKAAEIMGKSGYATDPKYGDKLKNIIINYKLDKYVIETYPPKIEIIDHTSPYPSELVQQLENRIKNLEIALESTFPPVWFNHEFPFYKEFISTHTGSNDFWRSAAISLRIYKQLKGEQK